jgi:hypothetical protein
MRVAALIALLAGQVLGQAIPGQVAWYRAENNALDSSGLGNHGSWTGTVAYADAVFGRGMDFDGANLVTSTVSNLTGASTFTFCAWAKIVWPEAIGEVMYIASVYDAATTNRVWTIQARGNASPAVDVLTLIISGNGATVAQQWSAGLEIPKAEIGSNWAHLSLIIEGGAKASMWLNGENVTGLVNLTDALHYSPTTPLSLGGTSGPRYTGQLDDVRIFNRALSADEIRRLYHGTEPLRRGP